MEIPKQDQATEDIALLFKVGLDRFLTPGNYEDTISRRCRLRDAYAVSWQKIRSALLEDSADWRDREDPVERLMGLFSQLCDLEDNPEISQYLHLAYMGLYNETSGHKVHGVLFDNAPEGTYAVDLIREEIRQIASEASFAIPEDSIAKYTMYHVASLHLMTMIGDETSVPNRFEVEMDYMDYLFENQRNTK